MNWWVPTVSGTVCIDDLVMNAIRHIRSISEKTPNCKSILSCIHKSTASNIDLPSVESTCTEMITNGIINKDLKILISSNCKSDAMLDDNVDFVISNESNPETPQRAPIQNQINAPVIETIPVITAQNTPNLPINSKKLGEIKANMMAIKSSFMNEIYELKNEILLLSFCDRNESKEPENSHTINILETKLVFVEKENSILRSELENTQTAIDSLSETNSSLFKSIRDPSSLFIQDSTSTDSKIPNGIHEINRKKLIQHTNQNRSRPQMSQILKQCQQRIVLS